MGSALAFSQALGTRENPIIWLFPPSTKAAVIQESANQIAAAVGAATGLYFETRVMPDYPSLNLAVATATGNVMAVPATDQYVRIAEMTNYTATPRLAAVRSGYTYYFTSVYALRSSGFTSLADLQGKVWIYNSEGSASGYVIPSMVFTAQNITFSNVVKSGGHPASLTALLEGQGDFCTAYGSPPVAPTAWTGPRWEIGDDPELWLWNRWTQDLPRTGYYGSCADVRLAVSKSGTYGTLDDLVRRVAVITTIGPIPNDCIVYAPGFPKEFEDAITEAIRNHIHTPEGLAIWNNANFYQWSDVIDVSDSYYDGYRAMVGLPIPPR
jgi:ABC-type phosphate/phosphonate transport system substrate-binding protein